MQISQGSLFALKPNTILTNGFIKSFTSLCFLVLRSTSTELHNYTWIARRLLALKGPEVASFQTISCFKTSCDKRQQVTPLGLRLPVGSTELSSLPESTFLEKKE